MRIFLPLLALLALLTACADGGTGGNSADSTSEPATGSDAAGDISRAENDLAIDVDLGDGSAPQSWTLTCAGSVEGSHPDAAGACAHLQGLENPFAPLPEDLMCTEQFGGPQTAHVTGLWRGEPVDLELSRTDGCHISQWDSLGSLLPA